MKKAVFTKIFCCLMWLGLEAHAQSPIKLAPLPLLEPCEQLNSGEASEQAVKPLLEKLRDKDAAVRAKAAEQLANGCHKAAVEPLMAVLRDEAPPVRVAAIKSLGQLSDRETLSDLSITVMDEDLGVKLALIQALCSFRSSVARNTVLNSIANPGGVEIKEETDARIRGVAILTLNELADVTHSHKAIFFAVSFTQSRHAAIRKVGEETMLALRDTRNAGTELIATLKSNKNPDMRRQAAYWLGKLAIERARDALNTAATLDANAAVKQAATTALSQLNAPSK
ncbi:MAG: HEAT repeat domain-containing protein [Acidobacteria bacterium]|nr:HEAT repeat domain-containing protein [Acidobacteriota bacterium]